MKENTDVQTESSAETWTEESLKSAKPLDLPIAKKPYSEQKTLEKTVDPNDKDRKAGDGKPPTLNVAPQGAAKAEGSAKQSATPSDKQGNGNKGDVSPGDKKSKADTQQSQMSGKSDTDMPITKAENEPLGIPRSTGEAALGVVPFNFGTQKAQFSSSRLVPESARLAYPYSAAGKLFFTIGNLRYICSASVIAPRLILTAGHCVHKGSGGTNGFYNNFLFIPAYHAGFTPPFQSWKWRFVVTTSTWATGNGAVPNAADYAIIELEDLPVGGTSATIGEVTGTFGWQTKSLDPNHTNKLGYPGNFDNAEQMHQVNSQHHRDIAPNNVEYGSDMRGGSSGGGWVQNFGIPAVGQTGGSNPGINRIVGVTSYGYIATDPLVQGSSVLDGNFLNVRNAACNHKTGNC